MLHIAVCDDEKSFIESLEHLLQTYAAETGLEIKVTPFYDGSELIEKYERLKSCGADPADGRRGKHNLPYHINPI